MKIGIIGLPNVGKSTLFNAILKREQALSANYPFATIEPNVGIVDVIDSRLDLLVGLVEQNEGVHPPVVYANIEFVDIAGLVAGASKGEGLGNQFLANIREVDMILHVVRDFSDKNIVREHSKDPETDITVINSELIYKDLESIEKRLKSISRDPNKQKDINLLEKYHDHLDKGGFAYELRDHIDENDYIEIIRPIFLLTDKDMIYVFNVDEEDDRLRTNQNNKGDEKNLYINAKLESELSSLANKDQKSYLQDLGILEAGLDKITRLCFKRLGLITFFTAGVKEVRAWEVKKGATAQEAAGVIHTDFSKNFIKAEVIKYKDYAELGSRKSARDRGKARLEGKEYIVQDADIIEFKVGA